MAEVTNYTHFEERKERYLFSAIAEPPFILSCVENNTQYSIDSFDDPSSNTSLVSQSSPCRKPGLAAQIFRFVAEQLRLEYDFWTPYGLNVTSSDVYSWSIAAFNRNLTDASVNLFTISVERKQESEFSAPVITYKRAFIIQTPSTNQASLRFAFLEPFSTEVWAFLFAAAFCTYLTLVLTFYLAIRFDLVPLKMQSRLPKSFWSNANRHLWVMVRALLNQSLPGSGETSTVIGLSSGRIMFCAWAMVFLMLNISYSSSLITHLFYTSTNALPFFGLDELAPLLLAGDYQMVLQGNFSEFLETINSSTGYVYQQVREAFVKYPPIFEANTDSLLHNVATNDSLVAYSNTIEAPWLVSSKCHLTIIADTYDSGKWMAFSFPKNSALRPRFDFVLAQIREIIISMARRYTADYDFSVKSCDPGANVTKPLGLEDIQGIFWVYTVFLSVAVIALCTEIMRPCILVVFRPLLSRETQQQPFSHMQKQPEHSRNLTAHIHSALSAGFDRPDLLTTTT